MMGMIDGSMRTELINKMSSYKYIGEYREYTVMNANVINSRISDLKLLEQFYTVLSREMYNDRGHAWEFCEILKEIVYDQHPTKEGHAIADALPHNDFHFDNTAVLNAITGQISAIVRLMKADETVANELKALLK